MLPKYKYLQHERNATQPVIGSPRNGVEAFFQFLNINILKTLTGIIDFADYATWNEVLPFLETISREVMGIISPQ